MSKKSGNDNQCFLNSEPKDLFPNDFHSGISVEEPQKDLENQNGGLTRVSWSMDDIISAIGLGPWTFFIFFVGGLSPMSETVNLLGSEFMAPPLDYTCADPYYDDSFVSINGTECSVEKLGINSTDGDIVSCSTFCYDNSTYETTLTEDFDLVCSKGSKIELFQLLFTVGCVVGSPVGGVLAERFGRQPTIFYSTLLMTLFTIVISTVTLLWVIMMCRFLLGFCTMVMINPGFNIGMEVCPLRYRATFGVMVALPYAVMLIMLAGISYLSRQWVSTQLWGSVPVFVLCICSSPFFLSESPRWLLSKGRVSDAQEVIHKGAMINKTLPNLPNDLQKQLAQIYEMECKKSEENSVSLWRKLSSLMSNKAMKILTISTGCIWFLESIIYLSVPLQASSFKSPFLYMALLGLGEMPAYSVTAPITGHVGRKPFLIGCFVLTGLFQNTLAINNTFNTSSKELVGMIFSAMSYTCICSAFQGNLIYCSELYPTSVRSLGLGLLFFSSNLGMNVVPIMSLIMPEANSWLAYVLYSCLSFTAALLTLLLPETNKKPLLETVEGYKLFVEGQKQQGK